MRFASWNIKGNNGIGEQRRGALVAALQELSPDVIVLQEVTWKRDLHKDLMSRFLELGWQGFAYGGVIGSTTKKYGNLIVSRFPLQIDHSDWVPRVPWRQSLLRVEATAPEGNFVVIAAHIPNGSGNGWRKIETFEALTEHLQMSRPIGPTLLAGDFNEPQAILEDGTVIPFTMKRAEDGQWSSIGNFSDTCGRTFPRQRWVDGVRAILGGTPAVDLLQVARVSDGPAAAHVTHEVQGKDRYFDHILVSPHWTVLQTGFNHDVRIDGISDHSLVWADVLL